METQFMYIGHVWRIPTGLLKECLDELLPVITQTINLSLEEGKFPSEWKGALVKPKLKKVDLNLIKENFRPLSNLQFLSKLTEKLLRSRPSRTSWLTTSFLVSNLPIVATAALKPPYCASVTTSCLT